MNYLITGGTGFVGQQLVEKLCDLQHHVYVLTRNPSHHTDTSKVTYISYDIEVSDLPIFEGVINLAGQSIFGYWTKQQKKAILQSRLTVTKKLLDLLRKMSTKPRVLVNGSAVGFYGMSDRLIFTEETSEAGADFLATVSSKWEALASEAETLGIRTVYSRFGVILGKHSGAFPLMSLPVKLFAGGKIGDGEQWLSWVHIDDVVGMMIHALTTDTLSGPMNVTSPDPKRNKDFMKMAAKRLHRPYWLPVPSFFLYLLLGEMSQLITKGQYAFPQKALDTNYQFNHPTLDSALDVLT